MGLIFSTFLFAFMFQAARTRASAANTTKRKNEARARPFCLPKTTLGIPEATNEEYVNLNNHLEQLVTLFPNHDVRHCRLALVASSMECKLENAAEILADSGQDLQGVAQAQNALEAWQYFRSTAYKAAVSRILCVALSY